MEKILLAHTRELCYYSGSFFLRKLTQALRTLGVEAEYISVPEERDWALLEERIGKSYDAVVDINSKLPYLLDGGTRLLDRMNAPFFNYILDHPLYHHPGLVFPLKDYHAIGIDREHCAYMWRYYPHLKSVTFLPVGATRAERLQPYGSRKIPLLFAGTYQDEDGIMEAFCELCKRLLPAERASDLQRLGEAVIERMLAGDGEREAVMERIVEELVTEDDLAEKRYGVSEFPLLMNELYHADQYVRNVRRRRVLEDAAKETELTVIGEGWEGTPLAENRRVSLLGAKKIGETFAYMADSRAVLDVNPLFASGVHDRVSSAMRNGALVLSDMSKDAAGGFTPGQTYLSYRSWEKGGIGEALAQTESAEAEAIAERGRRLAEKEYSWEAAAKRLLELIRRTNGKRM